jgi:hypothetical protein
LTAVVSDATQYESNNPLLLAASCRGLQILCQHTLSSESPPTPPSNKTPNMICAYMLRHPVGAGQRPSQEYFLVLQKIVARFGFSPVSAHTAQICFALTVVAA